MEKLSKEELETIVRRQMPSFRVVEELGIEADSPAPSQMRSPGLAAIQEKLRGTVQPYLDADRVVVTDAGGRDIVQTVTVQPRGPHAPQEAKTVLISAAKKSIIGQQG